MYHNNVDSLLSVAAWNRYLLLLVDVAGKQSCFQSSNPINATSILNRIPEALNWDRQHVCPSEPLQFSNTPSTTASCLQMRMTARCLHLTTAVRVWKASERCVAMHSGFLQARMSASHSHWLNLSSWRVGLLRRLSGLLGSAPYGTPRVAGTQKVSAGEGCG